MEMRKKVGLIGCIMSRLSKQKLSKLDRKSNRKYRLNNNRKHRNQPQNSPKIKNKSKK